jgi:hypothetical protein
MVAYLGEISSKTVIKTAVVQNPEARVGSQQICLQGSGGPDRTADPSYAMAIDCI